MDEARYIAWIRAGLKKPGKTQRGLAGALGIAHPQITQLLKGTRRLKVSEIDRIAGYLEEPLPDSGALSSDLVRVPEGQEFTPDPDFEASLSGGRGYAKGTAYKPALPGGRPEIDSKAGAGHGSIGEPQVVALDAGGTVSGHLVVAEWVLPETVFREEFRASPKGVIILAVDGESMRPTLEPGDRIFVDTQRTTFTSDGIYLIDDHDGEPRVKRLEKVLFSNPPQVIVRSDNAGHGEQTVELGRLRVLGKVCGRLTRM